jgi:hypothetical protein
MWLRQLLEITLLPPHGRWLKALQLRWQPPAEP